MIHWRTDIENMPRDGRQIGVRLKPVEWCDWNWEILPAAWGPTPAPSRNDPPECWHIPMGIAFDESITHWSEINAPHVDPRPECDPDPKYSLFDTSGVRHDYERIQGTDSCSKCKRCGHVIGK